MGVLELRDVTLELGGRRILNGLTVDFWEGHVHALIGPNGAGKSTLAGAIMGLPDYRHLRGEIPLDGEPIQDLPVDERARRADPLRRHSQSGLLARSNVGSVTCSTLATRSSCCEGGRPNGRAARPHPRFRMGTLRIKHHEEREDAHGERRRTALRARRG
jgi:ABC-type glutathione transport system ATPase component